MDTLHPRLQFLHKLALAQSVFIWSSRRHLARRRIGRWRPAHAQRNKRDKNDRTCSRKQRREALSFRETTAHRLALVLLISTSINLVTDNEDISSSDDPRLSELNTIRLVLDWVYVTEERVHHQPSAPPPNLGPIHEKAAKKAHGDSVGLGTVRPSASRQWYSTQSIGMKKTVLVFHYAPEGKSLATFKS